MKHLFPSLLAILFITNLSAQNWNRVGSQIYNLNGGNVGVGLNNPAGKLHVQSILLDQPWLDEDGFQRCGTSSLVVEGFKSPTGGCHETEPGEFDNNIRRSYLIEGILDDGTSKIRRFTVDQMGRLGIGDDLDPTADIDIQGNIRMRAGASSGFMLVSGSDGTMQWTDPKTVFNGGHWGEYQGVLSANDTTINVSLGTKMSVPGFKFHVNGGILCTELKVMEYTGWDAVFAEDYELLSLEEVKNYITEHKHLPHLKSAAEYESEGIDLSEMNGILLRKIEELTLYVLELKAELDTLKR
jgi:hypothetical protein